MVERNRAALKTRAYYSSTLSDFLKQDPSSIVGELSKYHSQDLVNLQTGAWIQQIDILKNQLSEFASENNAVFFEFGIPRMGKRADVVLVIGGLIFVLEFKVGASKYHSHDKDQVLDYGLDLKHFHAGSHEAVVIPMLVATEAQPVEVQYQLFGLDQDGLAGLLCADSGTIGALVRRCLDLWHDKPSKVEEPGGWAASAYKPTPTIVQAAQALYQGHNVQEISRSDGGAKNLSETAYAISAVIERAKANHEKAICFVTGVPGAGKTLAGLNITTDRMRSHDDEHAVFLSGNGPLVAVLREALARDERERKKIPKKDADRNAATFIQNIHHFRDDNLETEAPPVEKVVVFDEAQRAWDQANASKFMQQKRQQAGFDLSEPEFLVQVMDRHNDWCVIVALIGGGQEINTGEAGLPEWFSALRRSFSHWRVYYSSQLEGKEYTQGTALAQQLHGLKSESNNALHLGVSVRSFRAEKLSEFVGCIIDNQPVRAEQLYQQIRDHYPVRLTRDISKAREWLRKLGRGSELYGLIASSGANRLKPEGINIKAKVSPAEWFLNGKRDVRSCQYLEDVATEFDIQGLELDWVGVCWDANFRYTYGQPDGNGWSFNRFSGTKWQKVSKPERIRYLANSYRVLLTRARQGMVIFVPEGDDRDPTRPKSFYDDTYRFLQECGIEGVKSHRD
jgi:Schlafen group 3, DNA/RNA helicase domain